MCWCTPTIRTPWCGKRGCIYPGQLQATIEAGITAVDENKLLKQELTRANEVIGVLEGALEPLARKEIPEKAVGNAAAYSFSFKEIESAKQALAKAREIRGE